MTSALPIGNGEMGAMIFGSVPREQIQFNEKTLWTGDTTHRGAYQNFGDIFIEFNTDTTTVRNYRRTLSLDDAIAIVDYEADGVRYRREYFASNPDSVVVMRLTTPGFTGRLSFMLSLDEGRDAPTIADGNNLTTGGKLDLLSYGARVAVIADRGTVTPKGNKLKIENADATTIILSAATNYDINSPTYTSGDSTSIAAKVSRRVASATEKGYERLHERHLADYRSLYDRVKLDLDEDMPDYSTTELIRNHRDSRYLDMLYFQFGRYLMIASSRGMNLPNNLQGLWNNNNLPPWECDIHSNINIQMNYWPAEVANLAECHLPFINYVAIEAVRPNGSWQNVAQSENLRGWSIKTQSNIFGYTDWNINRPANAWYCTHLWQHYLYNPDPDYLKGNVYPAMKAACLYWFDRLKPGENRLLTAPEEWSPEHGPWEDGVAYAQQLIALLFDQTLQAATLIEPKSEFTDELKDKYVRLDRGIEIGDWNQIKEWKNYPDSRTDDHRHLSHLIGLYPGNHISPWLDPKTTEAARTSLTGRGDMGTGWSRAWKIACWARLLDGDHAYRLLKMALVPSYLTVISMDNDKGGVYENLFDSHPPFQIDGNFGATSGIAEMLLQSYGPAIHLLPAIPEAWKKGGSISGLRAENGFTVNITWRDGRLMKASILSTAGLPCRLVISEDDVDISITDKDGNYVKYVAEGRILSFDTEKGGLYSIDYNR